MLVSSPWLLGLRRLTRKIGLNRMLSSLISGARGGNYEDRFGPALASQIHSGDNVWDVGANVGLYTTKYLDLVGDVGRVVAFEPTVVCFSQLQQQFLTSSNVTLKNIALGDFNGTITMKLDDDPLAATHRITSEVDTQHQDNLYEVCVNRADNVVAHEPQLFPNIIKIDVEGHEVAVMDGMKPLLEDRRLRCIGMEVHFGLLDERGEGEQPRLIEQLLKSHGFSVSWTDPSHLLALR